MTAPDSVPLRVLTEENKASASPDLLRAMLKTFADALMSAEADALCNAEYGQVSDERVNHRNGYRPREWDTPAGTVEFALLKLRQGSYFPPGSLNAAAGPNRPSSPWSPRPTSSASAPAGWRRQRRPRRHPAAGLRRLGARLLPPVQERPPRLRHQTLGPRQLDGRRRAVHRRHRLRGRLIRSIAPPDRCTGPAPGLGRGPAVDSAVGPRPWVRDRVRRRLPPDFRIRAGGVAGPAGPRLLTGGSSASRAPHSPAPVRAGTQAAAACGWQRPAGKTSCVIQAVANVRALTAPVPPVRSRAQGVR